MSSSSSSNHSDSDSSADDILDAENIQGGILEPYQDEPLGDGSGSESDEENDEHEAADADGIQRAVLEQRYERITPLQDWSVKIFSFAVKYVQSQVAVAS